jgi:hypothetical protein
VLTSEVDDPMEIANADGHPGVRSLYRGVAQHSFVATYVFDTSAGSIGVAVTTAARYDAIDASGWAQPVHFLQLRNFSFWVLTFLLVVGALHTFSYFSPLAETYPGTLVGAAAWFVVYGLLVARIIHRLDRYSPVPGKLRVVALLIGGIVSTFAEAVFSNDAIISIVTKTAGISFSNDWGAAFAAPISEELAKGLAVVLLIDVGAGAVYLVGRSAQSARRVLGSILILSSIVLHFVGDALPALSNNEPSLLYLGYLLASAITVAVFVKVYRMAAVTEQQWMRDVLDPEVVIGTITGDELDAIVATRRVRRRYLKSVGGRHERRCASHVLEASRDLADKIARDRNDDSPTVEHARSEITRVRA